MKAIKLIAYTKKRSASIPWHSEVCDDLHNSTKRDAPDGALHRVLLCIFRRSQFRNATKHRHCPPKPTAMSRKHYSRLLLQTQKPPFRD